MRVLIPTPLRSYTSGRAAVEASGATVGALLDDLNTAFPGIRFRMIDEQDRFRQHIRIFVNRERVFELDQVLAEGDEVQIICAISGG